MKGYITPTDDNDDDVHGRNNPPMRVDLCQDMSFSQIVHIVDTCARASVMFPQSEDLLGISVLLLSRMALFLSAVIKDKNGDDALKQSNNHEDGMDPSFQWSSSFVSMCIDSGIYSRLLSRMVSRCLPISWIVSIIQIALFHIRYTASFPSVMTTRRKKETIDHHEKSTKRLLPDAPRHHHHQMKRLYSIHHGMLFTDSVKNIVSDSLSRLEVELSNEKVLSECKSLTDQRSTLCEFIRVQNTTLNQQQRPCTCQCACA